jgi:GDP/UDP-N,N'-diacetylbacillosamine 2-epimerase (hydrolysing)
MGGFGMRVGVLTSSRADYGIYKPLLKKLSEDSFFDLSLLVFGTHLSERFGYTVREIEEDGFNIDSRIETTPEDDTSYSIVSSMSRTIYEFNKLWMKEKFDIVVALGDRYEMFAAVASTVPYNIHIAHIHGGETTLGAIDNAFRNSITHFSSLHFTSCDIYRDRVIDLTEDPANVFNAGALSIDNMRNTELFTPDEVLKRFSIDISAPFILMTFHPETKAGDKNSEHIKEIISAIKSMDRYRFVITMPNADPMGMTIRDELLALEEEAGYVKCIENLGSRGYFTCLSHCRMMFGNSSSGFTEAVYFDKPVVNIGDRQRGRIVTANIFNCRVRKEDILKAVKLAEDYVPGTAVNIYGNGGSADFIALKLREFYNKKQKADA